MAEPTFFFYFFLLLLLLFLGAVIKVFALKKENNLLAEQLTETTVALERTRQNLTKLQEKHEKIVEFQNSLGEAERTTNLQMTRLNEIRSPERPRNSPERYSYIHSLTEKGLSVEEIASILTISTHEARQLVALSKIAQGN
ncbi:MAG: hypothetical protein KJ630_17475 [Proteobacteria bacterium]|nr:hypothetical protein [Pseudomonadota bacterium]